MSNVSAAWQIGRLGCRAVAALATVLMSTVTGTSARSQHSLGDICA